MGKKASTSEAREMIPINMPPPGWHQQNIVTVTWFTTSPLAAGGYKSAGISVTCTLTGPAPSNASVSQPATELSDSEWEVDFGFIRATGNYTFKAEGSDESSCSVGINLRQLPPPPKPPSAGRKRSAMGSRGRSKKKKKR
jgi:hypothetical protein